MARQETARTGDLTWRLYSVARGLEDEGQNNIAKLLRAAALGEMYRSSQDRPRQGAGLEEAFREVVTELNERPATSASLKVALARGLEAFEQGDWPLLTEIPATYVCRFCGEVMIGEPPDRCPGCRARPLTYQESLPVFYLEPMDREELKQALRANLADVERSVEGISEEEADRGAWPMREMMSHLNGAQELMIGRAYRILAEDNPNLESVAPTDIGARNDDGPASMPNLLQAFRSARQELIERIDTFSDDDFTRPGNHPEWGRLTVLSQLTYMVRHEQSHLAELEARSNGQ